MTGERGAGVASRFCALSLINRNTIAGGAGGIVLDHQQSWRDGSGQITRSDVYGIANLHYGSLAGSNAEVLSVRLASADDRLWGSIGAGGTFSWANGRYALYGEVAYNTSLGDFADSCSYKGAAGLRVQW